MVRRISIKDVSREDKVAQFVEAASKVPWNGNYSTIDQSVIGMIKEEFFELWEAAYNYEKDPDNVEYRANLCKEWADLQYVISQFAWYYGIPADEAFNRVHESNMSKFVNGEAMLREDGKILKGPNYQPPDMRGL